VQSRDRIWLPVLGPISESDAEMHTRIERLQHFAAPVLGVP